MPQWKTQDFSSIDSISSAKNIFGSFDHKSSPFFCIPRAQDSHVHLQGIGKYSGDKNFSDCHTLQAVKTKIEALFTTALAHQNFNTSATLIYLEGFGLDLNQHDIFLLSKWCSDLSLHFTSRTPVVLSLVFKDGHQLFMSGDGFVKEIFPNLLKNSELMQKNSDLELFKFEDTVISLVAGDRTRPELEQILQKKWHSNPHTHTQNLDTDMLLAQKTLLQSGYSHCRDMTSDMVQFNSLLKLETQNKFHLYADLFFSNFKGEAIDQLVLDLVQAKDKNSHHIQAKGIKIFLDGSLAGKNLDCSCTQLGPSPHHYSATDIYDILLLAQQHEFEVAFHCIGDLAFKKIIEGLLKISGLPPIVHLEHCEFIHPYSFKHLSKIQFKDRLQFHFQPTHWIEDHPKVPTEAQNLHFFSWEKLLPLGFNQVFFGSDAPVEPPFFQLDQLPPLLPFLKEKTWVKPWWKYFSHSDTKRGINTFSIFRSDLVPNTTKGLDSNTISYSPEVFIDGNLIKH